MSTEVLCRALSDGHKQFTVLPTGYTTRDFLKQVAEHHPEVAVISASSPDGSTGALGIVREVCAAAPNTRVVLLVDCSEPKGVIEAFLAGAKGVVCKNDSFKLLCKCIRSVHAGQIWASSVELQWIVEALAQREPVRILSAKGIPRLTERENEIVRLGVEGLPNNEIAQKLGLSEHTVKNHLFRVYEKLGVTNRVELILYALSNKPGSPEPEMRPRQPSGRKKSDCGAIGARP